MTHPLSPEIIGATLLVGSLTSWITDEDWNRLVGPWGGFLISILFCGILLRHTAKRIKREDERTAAAEKAAAERAEADNKERERRHKEAMSAQEAVSSKFEALTVRQMDTQLETAKALLKLAHNCETLHAEMKSRPCQQLRCGDNLPA